MRLSRRELEAELRARGQRIEDLVNAVDEAHRGERACVNQLHRVASELSRVKSVVATHLLAAGPEAESLRRDLAAAGVDLRLELARLEGADL
jgi:hypothetical protein